MKMDHHKIFLYMMKIIINPGYPLYGWKINNLFPKNNCFLYARMFWKRNWEVEVENVIIPIKEQFWERKEWGNETAGAQDLSWNQRAHTLD
jgi:hypothetical protein